MARIRQSSCFKSPESLIEQSQMEHFCIYLKVRGQRKQPDVCQAARCWGVQLGLQAKMKVTIKPLIHFLWQCKWEVKEKRHWLTSPPCNGPRQGSMEEQMGDKSHCQGALNKSSCFLMDLCGYRKKGKSWVWKVLSQSEKNSSTKGPGLGRGALENISAKVV